MMEEEEGRNFDLTLSSHYLKKINIQLKKDKNVRNGFSQKSSKHIGNIL